MATRKLHFVKEMIFAEAGRAAPRPVSRVAAIAVIDNPFGGRVEQDLSAFAQRVWP
jgi:Amino acid synthesis